MRHDERGRSAVERHEAANEGRVDYDLHGLVGVRAIDASAADAAVLTRQLGPILSPLEREPDIVVRFVDELKTPGLRYVGLDEAAFTDDAFLVLRSKHKARARVQIPFEQIGQRIEIVCERGLPAVPLLVPILNLTALANGALPLHGSSFTFRGTGVVVTGWTKGGKTEALLAFMTRGAAYVGDEWVYLSGDGGRVFGIPEPIRLWDWHLRELPEYGARVERGDRARLRVLRFVQSLDGAIPRTRGRSLPVRTLRRALPLVRRQLFVDIDPERLFDAAPRPLAGGFDRLFFVVSHESPEITVEPVDPLEVAHRMVFSLQHERLDLLRHYLAFRFAFPGAENPVIERARDLERETLARIVRGKTVFAVHHPYPTSIGGLFDAMSPYC